MKYFSGYLYIYNLMISLIFLANTHLDRVVTVQLWSEREEFKEPRYTLTIVDGELTNGAYAVFIVPQGIL